MTVLQQWKECSRTVGDPQVLLVVGDEATRDAVAAAAARVLGVVPHIAVWRGTDSAAGASVGANGGMDGAHDTDDLIRAAQPRTVIGVGTATGLGPLDHHRPGDIVVATMLRVVGPGFEPRLPDLVPRSVRMLDRCTLATIGWRRGRVHFGPVLSAGVPMDTPARRAAALDAHPGAMAAETDGAGVFAAAQRAGVDWAVVKAVGGTSDPAAEFVMQMMRVWLTTV